LSRPRRKLSIEQAFSVSSPGARSPALSMTIPAEPAAAPVTATSLVRMLQLGDSMFPVGGYAFSSSLEAAIQKQVVTDAATLRAFTLTAVEQAALGDGIGLLHAHRAAAEGDLDEVARIDHLLYARKLSSGTRTMSTRMGKKLAEMGATVIALPLLAEWRERIAARATPGCYPVALAVCFAAQNLPAREAFVVHQYGVAATILSAALRLMRISHVDTQSILYQLNAQVEPDYQTAAAARLPDMASFAPLTEILAAVHVKAHGRLFMN
jgi:urease accessory protein